MRFSKSALSIRVSRDSIFLRFYKLEKTKDSRARTCASNVAPTEALSDREGD